MVLTETELDQLREEAARVRASNVLGRSDLLLRLFDFLLARSIEGRVPKEVELGLEVFSRNDTFETMQDASVRVYVHRLRRKLDEYYAREGAPGTYRLFLPRGEYRLSIRETALADEGVTPEPGDDALDPPGPRPRRPGTPPRWWMWAMGLAACIIVLLAAAIYHDNNGPMARAQRSAFWKGVGSSGRPVLIVYGDYFIFGEAPDGIQVSRLVREYAINSRNDLDAYLMEHPEKMGLFVNLGLTYAPNGATSALGLLLPLLDQDGRHATVIPMSSLTADMLRDNDIVYVGYSSGLGILRDEIFGASRFRVGKSYDELIDKKSGKTFGADWAVIEQGGQPRRDYLYIARLPGPNGNTIIVIAGTRDAAVMEGASILADPRELDAIGAAAKGSTAVEALYRVDSMANKNLGGTLVTAGPLAAANLWRGHGAPDASFPDTPGSGASPAPPQ